MSSLKCIQSRVKKAKQKSLIFHSSGHQPHGLKPTDELHQVTVSLLMEIVKSHWHHMPLGIFTLLILAAPEVNRRGKKEKWELVRSQPWLLSNGSQPRLEEVGIPWGGTQAAAFFRVSRQCNVQPGLNFQIRLKAATGKTWKESSKIIGEMKTVISLLN